ncbi:MAG: sulfotransferase, partial [Gammaproteobacteria bacterium]|nr:sulfotransferase [Gammaproteobacteria bacterium]
MAHNPAAGSLPTFLVIGAPKCGTTSLYHYLDQHPDVYLSPVKEPQYFAFAGQQLDFRGPGVTINNAVTELADYRKLFSGASVEKAIGEASALYLSVPGTAERIRAQIPDVRLIAILRRPADRAFSSYMHLIRDDREPMRDFAAALAAEEQRIADNWGFLWRYKQLGRYYEQLKHYYDI